MTIRAVLSRGEALNVATALVSKSASFLQAEKVALAVLRACAKWETFDWTRVKALVDAHYVKQVNRNHKRFKKSLDGDVGNEHY